MRESWVQDAQLAVEEARRRAKQRQAAYAVALDMRAEGHTLEEIRERTGVSRTTLGRLFRGLGRRT